MKILEKYIYLLYQKNITVYETYDFHYFFQLFLEELAEKEKMARKLNEPSMYVDYLDDDLKLNSVTGEHNTVIKIGKKV